MVRVWRKWLSRRDRQGVVRWARLNELLAKAPTAFSQDPPRLRRREQISLVKNRMREICTSGSVRGGDGDIPTYSAFDRAQGIETFGEGVGLGQGRECAGETQLTGHERRLQPCEEQCSEPSGEDAHGRKTPVCSPPIEFDPAKGHRLGQCSADAGGDTHAHNTLSPNDTGVRFSTPFTRFMVRPCRSFADRSEEMGRSVSWTRAGGD